MYFKVTYHQDFDDLWMHLRSKYPEKLFDLDGVGEQLDMSKFSREFFSKSITADSSVDANANVDDNSVIAYVKELPKPFFRINSYYMLWKELRRLYGKADANRIIEKQLSGDIYINDFHGLGSGIPYSYHPQTNLIVRINGEIQFITIEDLFNKYINNVKYPYDMEEIDLTNIKDKFIPICNRSHNYSQHFKKGFIERKDKIEVLDHNGWVNVSRVLRHRPHNKLLELNTKNGLSTIVTEDHPCLIESETNGEFKIYERKASILDKNDKLKESFPLSELFEKVNVEEDFAYLIGFYIGDGWATSPTGHTKGYVCISQKDIKEHKIYNIIDSYFDNAKYYKDVNNKYGKYEKVRFGGTQLYNYFVNDICIGDKSYEKKLPCNILDWNKKSVKSLICGIIDSEGTIQDTGNIQIRMNSFALIQQISTIAKLIGLHNVRTRFLGKQSRENSYKTNKEIYSVSFRIDKAKLSESIKVNLFDKEIKNHKDGRWETNDIYKIKEYEDDIEYVYDITTSSGTFSSQGLLQHNCMNYSTYDVMTKGLPMIDKIKSVPPKFLYSFKSQLEQFAVIAANSTLGATGLADLFVVMSYYVKNLLDTKTDAHFNFKTKEDCWNYVKENLVSFIYTINQPNRSGLQCLSEDTEILTKDGWKGYQDINIGDSIYTMNLDSNQMELSEVKRMFEKRYDGIMYNLKNRIQDQLITPNHRIVRKPFYSNKYMLEPIEDTLKLKSPFIIPIACDSNSGLEKSDDDFFILDEEIKLLAWIISEGSYPKTNEDNRLSIYQSHIVNKDNYDEIIKILDILGYEYSISDNNMGLGSDSKRIRILTNSSKIIMKKFFKDRNIKTIPKWTYNLSQRQSKIFIDTYLKGDGDDSSDRIVTTDLDILNGLEVLAVKAGYGIVSREKSIEHNTIAKKQQYSIRLIKHKDTYIQTIDKINYKGIVWCPTTNNGTVIAKRKGKVFITGNSPFTNVSIYDKYFLESLKEDYIFPDGSTPDMEIVNELQKLFLEIMNEELARTPITFPVTTACFSIDKKNNIKDKSFVKLVAKYNKKYGFINIFCGESSVLSSCCRLRSDTKSEYFNSFGAGSTKIGSLGVVTMNLPRLAIKYKYDEDKFFEKLKKLVKISAQINNCKRKLVQKRIDNGNHPLYDHDFIDLDKQYSTCGVNGLNECIEELGYDILSEDGQAMVLDIIKIINEENERYEKQYDAPHNCEQVPGENLSIRLAEKDKLLKFHDKYDLYSNQFIPLTINADVLDRITLQGKFDKHFSGGAVCHINIDAEIKDPKKIEDLIISCAKQGIVYWAINYNLQECENHHMSVGKGDKCNVCGKSIINNYTRVVGFLTNVKNWHKKRREDDYPNRKWYNGEVSD